MLVELFKALNKNFPPPDNKKHYLVYDDESDELKLGIWIDCDSVQTCFLKPEEEKELHNPAQLIEDIRQMMAGNNLEH